MLWLLNSAVFKIEFRLVAVLCKTETDIKYFKQCICSFTKAFLKAETQFFFFFFKKSFSWQTFINITDHRHKLEKKTCNAAVAWEKHSLLASLLHSTPPQNIASPSSQHSLQFGQPSRKMFDKLPPTAMVNVCFLLHRYVYSLH